MPSGTGDELESIAWQFLCSHYTGPEYWDSSLERRLDAFLRHRDRADILNDGGAYDCLVARVMANMARARADGLLDVTNRGRR
jgi:hypothetical protein